jgi:cellulose synthase/poly-beta-1,6-N-acetylglucosamine synthase-like glycosyltransferase
LGPRGFAQADHLLSGGQKLTLLAAAALLVAIGIQVGLRDFLLGVNAVITTLFLLATLYRLYLIDISLKRRREIRIPADSLQPPDGEWPRYVIQVPLYKEPHALPHLVKALSELDYPVDRLTVTVVEIPVVYPRTKPKACNVGLAVAEGDFLVIYDAEDRPEPDQLKKAVCAFSQCAETTACIQAKLNFYNIERNLLTRCFAAEYAMWFDLCLPGLDHLRAPIPLGGTSNHFRMDVLKRLQGWDEFNVTEDCDLGLRLFVNGWQTRILDSTTWEEACPRFFPWIRQRSRWVKGYVQTYIVHTRDFIGLTRKLGLTNSLHFHLLIGGSVLCQLLSLLYWVMVSVWLIYHGDPETVQAIGAFFPGPVFVMAATCLFVGNFVLAYCSAIACIRRDLGEVVKYTVLMPLYWMAMAFAAWKGTLQLIWRPHYWEKTQHLHTPGEDPWTNSTQTG